MSLGLEGDIPAVYLRNDRFNSMTLRAAGVIVFNSAGRAFVYHSTGISVLDPPYTAIAFTIPVSGNGSRR